MTNKNFTFLCCIFLLLGCQNAQSNEKQVANKPNIILIMADDLGYGDLGCYGQLDIHTPHIDRMATEGMRFTQHYAGSTVCAPSRSVLMTGMHTGHTRVRGNTRVPLAKEDVTIAEALKEVGYVTAQFGKWGIGELGTDGHPNKKGFDYFVGYLSQIRAHNAYPEWVWENEDTLKLDNEVEIIQKTYAKGQGGVATVKKTHTHDIFVQKTIDFIQTHQDTNFFLYLPLTLPHANNEARHWDSIGMEVPELMGYDSKTEWSKGQQAFAAAISYTDRDVGRILETLKTLNIDENTLVLFTSDNGPHQEGGNDPQISNSSGGLRGIKRDLYEGGIRVPLVAWWPNTIKAGQTTNHSSAFWDIFPTLTELAQSANHHTDGISFLPTLLGNNQSKHDYFYWEFYEDGGKQAVRMGNWKGIRLGVNENANAPIELYNLSEDVAETKNISTQFPEIVKQIGQIMNSAHTYSADFNYPHEQPSLKD